MYMVKPVNTLAYLTTLALNGNGFGNLIAGITITAIAFIKLNISVFSINFLGYLLLLFVAVLFQYAIMVAIGATSFVAIQSGALLALYAKACDFARYPISIYKPSLVFLFTFLFPVSVSSFYPVEMLLRGLSPLTLVGITIPVLVIFGIALTYWNRAMRNYTSAGG